MCPNSDMKPTTNTEGKIDPKSKMKCMVFKFIIFVRSNKRDEKCRENKKRRELRNGKEKWRKNLPKFIRFICLEQQQQQLFGRYYNERRNQCAMPIDMHIKILASFFIHFVVFLLLIVLGIELIAFHLSFCVMGSDGHWVLN